VAHTNRSINVEHDVLFTANLLCCINLQILVPDTIHDFLCFFSQNLPLFEKHILVIVAYRRVPDALIDVPGCHVRQVHEQRTERPA
jgi:hypothetical protein